MYKNEIKKIKQDKSEFQLKIDENSQSIADTQAALQTEKLLIDDLTNKSENRRELVEHGDMSSDEFLELDTQLNDSKSKQSSLKQLLAIKEGQVQSYKISFD